MDMTTDNEKSPKSINQNVLNEDVSDVENSTEGDDYDPGDEEYDTGDEDYEDEDYDPDDEDPEDIVEDYQAFLYSLFPSKYLKNKIKDKKRNKTESKE